MVREIKPFRSATKKWMRDNAKTPEVQDAVRSLDSLLSASGRSESAFSLRGKSPKERARIALARLYEAGKRGAQLLEIVLIIKAAISVLGPRGNPEFQRVQVAKLAHRLASGTILRNHEGRPYRDIYRGKPSLFERYPRAEGTFMRVLGEQILSRASVAAGAETISEIVSAAELGGGATDGPIHLRD